MKPRARSAAVALIGTAVLAGVLLLMSLSGAKWLGIAVIPILFFVLMAREATITSWATNFWLLVVVAVVIIAGLLLGRF